MCLWVVSANLFCAENLELPLACMDPQTARFALFRSSDLYSICRCLKSAGASNPRLCCRPTCGNADIGSDLRRPVDPKIKDFLVSQLPNIGHSRKKRTPLRPSSLKWIIVATKNSSTSATSEVSLSRFWAILSLPKTDAIPKCGPYRCGD